MTVVTPDYFPAFTTVFPGVVSPEVFDALALDEAAVAKFHVDAEREYLQDQMRLLFENHDKMAALAAERGIEIEAMEDLVIAEIQKLLDTKEPAKGVYVMSVYGASGRMRPITSKGREPGTEAVVEGA